MSGDVSDLTSDDARARALDDGADRGEPAEPDEPDDLGPVDEILIVPADECPTTTPARTATVPGPIPTTVGSAWWPAWRRSIRPTG